MNHKCCDCSYDSLFVKEVIRTYCGDSKSVDEPTPPIIDPDLPEEPELPEEPGLPPEEQPGQEVNHSIAISKFNLVLQ